MVASLRNDPRSHVGSHLSMRRGGIRRALTLLAALVCGALLQPLVAGASLPKDANPHGVLTYGIDLNDEFDNTFSPEQSLNPCGFAILSNIYASGLGVTNTAFIPTVITELVDDSQHRDPPHPAGCRVLQR